MTLAELARLKAAKVDIDLALRELLGVADAGRIPSWRVAGELLDVVIEAERLRVERGRIRRPWREACERCGRKYSAFQNRYTRARAAARTLNTQPKE